MHARRHQPDQDKGEQRPQNQRAIGPSGQSSAAITAAEPCAAAAQQLLERRDVAGAKAPAPAPRRFAPRTAGPVVARRIAAAIASALAPGTLIVGEQAADTAAPPRNHRHRSEYRGMRNEKQWQAGTRYLCAPHGASR